MEKILPRDERMGAPSLLRSGEGHAARHGRERPGSGAGRARAPAVADAAKKIAVRRKTRQGRGREADKRRTGLADPGDGKN